MPALALPSYPSFVGSFGNRSFETMEASHLNLEFPLGILFWGDAS